jgi:hypothetical protein
MRLNGLFPHSEVWNEQNRPAKKEKFASSGSIIFGSKSLLYKLVGTSVSRPVWEGPWIDV